MTEGSILLANDLAAVHLDQVSCLLVTGLGEHIVGANKEHLLADVLHEPRNEFSCLLVRHVADVDNVRVYLLALGVGRINQKRILVLEGGKRRLTARRCIAAHSRDHLVLLDQLLDLFCRCRGVGSVVFVDILDFLSVHSAGCVDLVERHLTGVRHSLFDQSRGTAL